MRARWGLAAVALLTVSTACSDSAPLGPAKAATLSAAERVRPRELIHFGFQGFGAHGKERIYFESAELVGVPRDVEVVAIWALNVEEAGEAIGVLRDGLDRERYRRRAITEIVLTPGQPEAWEVIATLRGAGTGRLRIQGLRIRYRAGARSATQFYPYRLELRMVPRSSGRRHRGESPPSFPI